MRLPLRLPAAILLTLVLSAPAAAAPELNPDYPETYTVRRGDTLWDIAGRYLRDPWRWPELWQGNREIGDPDLIYPGDVLRLGFVGGEPRLSVERSMRTVKLSPRVRSTPLDLAVPTIPVGAVNPFLSRAYVLDEAAVEAAPYVVDFPDEHVLAGLHDSVYVRSIFAAPGERFEIVRPGDAYRDPQSGDVLGYKAEFVADGVLERAGDPARVQLASVAMEAGVGDRLIPAGADEPLVNFLPRPGPAGTQGRIISVLNGVSQIGQYNVVVLNLGTDQGLEAGHVYEIFNGGERVTDTVRSGGANWNWRDETPLDAEFWYGGARIRGWLTEELGPNAPLPPHVYVDGGSDTFILPYERAGTLMVFRTFDRVSFGLVLDAVRPMHLLDTVRPPRG